MQRQAAPRGRVRVLPARARGDRGRDVRGVREAPRPPPEAPLAVGMRRLTAAKSAPRTDAATANSRRGRKPALPRAVAIWYN